MLYEVITIRDTIAQFDALRHSGLIGPERRLAWVETLDAARQRLKIDSVSYEILPQRRLDESTTTELAWIVITWYSIHYTKLYDWWAPGC